ncbi:MAG: molybdopterin-guanine dinucleotide biosynthesis protein B [Desulfobaccales bacterium]
MIASPVAPPSTPISPAPGDKSIAIVGPSNSGKTVLICRLLQWFAAQNLRVAVLKHSHHQHLGDDGKDTWHYRQAGAPLAALVAPGLLQITRSDSQEPSLMAVLAQLAPAADLILVEGYKTSHLPKLALAPPDAAAPLPDYSNLLAWVSAVPRPTGLPVFHPDQVAEIGRFIQAQLRCR